MYELPDTRDIHCTYMQEKLQERYKIVALRWPQDTCDAAAASRSTLADSASAAEDQLSALADEFFKARSLGIALQAATLKVPSNDVDPQAPQRRPVTRATLDVLLGRIQPIMGLPRLGRTSDTSASASQSQLQ
ncbi:hypothetical protein L917_04753 [Phytophthora nicotianae]|uniref:Uncharacterized protein n=4 Tax=Phytophthora nicotianae TaxID=4792 RepID=W2QIP9_PHYN3|nr:hypothetical protein PPTG_22488 [Phytophthora nicotianae INRA-310]ETI51683.1 hypothetical protein F443_05035 [Phytophthora nicotianae P1569]ETL98114.1 hypothetical protein L917_04753 [Phytophthora nicotianae]ETO80436.1 hypothetical protein F444_05085 [Phytophthora nicotianae P1976]ETM51316.1 hypothetical protein L914_04857 [Phytophthora nicotianae]ETN12419.1 hypothetical protein PPTG_22488 [Phytophthora nicotianae INRA-310]